MRETTKVVDDTSFLGLHFVPLQLSDRQLCEEIFASYPQTLSGYNFTSLYGWNQIYRFLWTQLEDLTLLIAAWDKEEQRYHLVQPVGVFSDTSQEFLLKQLSLWPDLVKIIGASTEFLENFPSFCAHFLVEEDRDRANYLYRTVDLANLEGRRFEKKRNLISQVDKFYHWILKDLDATCQDCPRILLKLGEKGEDDPGIQEELLVLNTILHDYDHLRAKGYMIQIENKTVAFSIVDELNPTTQVVLFEKADRQFKGLFQLINRETSKKIQTNGYEWINREEDMGIEGLRRAKLSYQPSELIMSYTLTYRKTK